MAADAPPFSKPRQVPPEAAPPPQAVAGGAEAGAKGGGRKKQGKGGGGRKKKGAKASRDEDEDVDLGAEGEEVVDVRRHLVTLYKMSLNSAQMLRKLVSTVLLTYLLPTSHTIAKSALAAGTAYDAQAKQSKVDEDCEHPIGPPHTHVFASMVDSALAMAPPVLPEAQLKTLRLLAEAMSSGGPTLIGGLVLFCMAKETYVPQGGGSGSSATAQQPPRVKVTVSFDLCPLVVVEGLLETGSQLTLALKTAFHNMMTSAGAEVKTGPAPRSQLERVCQLHLKALQR